MKKVKISRDSPCRLFSYEWVGDPENRPSLGQFEEYVRTKVAPAGSVTWRSMDQVEDLWQPSGKWVVAVAMYRKSFPVLPPHAPLYGSSHNSMAVAWPPVEEKGCLWFDVICPWVQGSGMSGGDRIWIEFAKAWKKAGHAVSVITSEEGRYMAIRSGLEFAKIPLWEIVFRPRTWIAQAFLFFTRTVRACYESATVLWVFGDTPQAIYSASDFWPDSLPALIGKIRYPKIVWVAGFYLFAPKPWTRPLREWVRGWTYWLTQKVAYRIIIRYSDIMCVTTEESKARVIRDGRTMDNVIVVRGGVDTRPANEWLAKGVSGLVSRLWDAVFVGRLHHTKGLRELVDAWQLVVGVLPEANLAIIGDGEMSGELQKMIISANLEKRIKILGFLDGEMKHEVFKRSKIFVSPTTYNGGMAAIEGMAWGLPAVGFDLPSQRAYYPKGMIRVAPGDVPMFASAIVTLLTEGRAYARFRHEGLELAKEWDWGARAQMVVDAVWRKVDQNGST